MLYWLMKWVFLGPLMRAWFRPEVRGAENLPRSGGALVASNHLAVLDSFVLPLMVPRRMAFPAKAEYFTTPGVIGTLQRWFFSGMGNVPIERGNGRAARAALDTGIGVMREGRLFGIYPEGTRSPDGRLYKGRTGVARMALEAKVPVVPVAMVGTDRANPVGSRFWRPVQDPDRDRRAARLLALLRHRQRPPGGAGAHRRGDVHADGALRAGVRRRVRLEGQGGVGFQDHAADPQSGEPAPGGPGGGESLSVARIFYDCEFIEDGTTIELVSLGAVDEAGREFYAVSRQFDADAGRAVGAQERARQAAAAVRSGAGAAACRSARPSTSS